MSKESRQLNENCRCCTNPSDQLFELIDSAKIDGTEDKSYYDLLQAVTNEIIATGDEIRMPQMICRKCVKQLKSSYCFIQQIRNTFEYYRNIAVEPIDDVKAFDQLHETLIEYPTAPDSKDNDDKGNHLNIKEEVGNINVADSFSNTSLDFNDIDDDNIVKEDIKEEIFLDIDHNEGSPYAEPHSDSDQDDYDIESLHNDDINELIEPIACRCDVCHKVFSDKRSLAVHKRFSHMPENEKIPCPKCDYKSSRSSVLKVHMGLKHGPETVEQHFKPTPRPGKQYPCDMCDRGYQRKEDLTKHIWKKHKHPQSHEEKNKRRNKPVKAKEEQLFLCAWCGQSYTSKKALNGHQLTHTGERPYICDICQKAFKRIKDMKSHRLIHSDEKPFQCSQCSKSFKRSDKLKMHMRVHSELRPYKCTECEKTFKYPCVLKTHMYMHTGQTPFACNTCGEAFSLRTSLNNHCLKIIM